MIVSLTASCVQEEQLKQPLMPSYNIYVILVRVVILNISLLTNQILFCTDCDSGYWEIFSKQVYLT